MAYLQKIKLKLNDAVRFRAVAKCHSTKGSLATAAGGSDTMSAAEALAPVFWSGQRVGAGEGGQKRAGMGRVGVGGEIAGTGGPCPTELLTPFPALSVVSV